MWGTRDGWTQLIISSKLLIKKPNFYISSKIKMWRMAINVRHTCGKRKKLIDIAILVVYSVYIWIVSLNAPVLMHPWLWMLNKHPWTPKVRQQRCSSSEWEKLCTIFRLPLFIYTFLFLCLAYIAKSVFEYSLTHIHTCCVNTGLVYKAENRDKILGPLTWIGVCQSWHTFMFCNVYYDHR